MGATDDLLASAQAYAAGFDKGALAAPPARRVAVLACMDARLNVSGLLGLTEGDAHVIRNAGGLVTDDAIRSLAVSQRALGTEEIILIHHTECGLLGFDDEAFRRGLRDESGVEPPWAVETFDDVAEGVRRSIARIVDSPFIPHRSSVRGFVYEVASGRLREVA